jgi:hypothetical protein
MAVGDSLSFEYLFGSEADEEVVISVVAAREAEDEAWTLVHGSVLVVPQACAAMSWPEWLRDQGHILATAYDPPLAADSCAQGGRWALARSVCNLREAENWLDELWDAIAEGRRAKLPALGQLEDVGAHLAMPTAIARVTPGVDSSAASLVSGMGRPVQALVLPVSDAPELVVPEMVEIGGAHSFNPSRDITGIHVTQDWVDPKLATTKGLLIGRAERRAWIRDARGTKGYKRYIAEVGWDPARIDISSLVLSHTEYLNRDVVLANRLALEDIDSREIASPGAIAIEVPTLGRSVSHELHLHTVEGELLDRNGPYHLVERIEMRPEINGAKLKPIVIGDAGPAAGLQARLERRQEIEVELAKALESAAQARILAGEREARERLTEILKRARSELLIMDLYFGQAESDWRLLDDVPVGVRVLTGKLPMDGDGEALPVDIGAHVEVKHRPKAKIHERVYLWDGGGLTIGGSPTTFGKAPLRLAMLTAEEAKLWHSEFELLWSSPLFKRVERKVGAGATP